MEEHLDLRTVKTEEGAAELSQSGTMQPYMKLAVAVMGNQDATDAVQKIRELPLDERYIWRIISALKWAFADFDTLNVEVDRQTLETSDLQSVLEMVKPRPIQFCLFLSTLVGPEQMERTMLQAIALAKKGTKA